MEKNLERTKYKEIKHDRIITSLKREIRRCNLIIKEVVNAEREAQRYISMK